MPGGQRADPDDVHVGLDGLARDLGGRLEQRAHVDVEAEVGERRRDRPSGRGRGRPDPSWRPGCAGAGPAPSRTARRAPAPRGPSRPPPPRRCTRPRSYGSGRCSGRRPPPWRPTSHRPWPWPGRRRSRARAGWCRAVPSEPERAASVSRFSAARVASSSRSARSRSSLASWLARTAALSTRSTSIGSSSSTRVAVDADDRLLAGVDARLGARGGLLDAHLGDAGLDRLRHAAGGLDLLDVLPGPLGEVGGEPLDVGGAGPRVDDPGRARLLLQHQLGVAGDAGREVGGQGDGLVEGVGVQALGVALGGRHRLDAGAHDVVEDVLRGERPARGLAVGAQRERLGVGRALVA